MSGLEALPAIGLGLQAGGTLLGAAGQRSAGDAANAQYRAKAQQEEQAAGQARAAAQREMLDEQRKELLAQSSLQARAASDGGSATDPTVLTLSQGIGERGALNASAALFRGEERARGLEDQAKSDRLSGFYAKKGSRLQSTATLLSGAGSIAAKYGGAPSGQGGSGGGLSWPGY